MKPELATKLGNICATVLVLCATAAVIAVTARFIWWVLL